MKTPDPSLVSSPERTLRTVDYHHPRFWRTRRTVLGLVILGFAVHLLFPQLADLEKGLATLRTGRWPYLLVLVAGANLDFGAVAWAVRASVDVAPPWGRTVLVQVAASAASTLTPLGVGWAAVTESFLETEGVEKQTAKAATGLNMLLAVVSHVGLLLLLTPLLTFLPAPPTIPRPGRGFLYAAVLVAVAAGVVWLFPRLRRRAFGLIGPVLEAAPALLRNPRRSAVMAGAATAANLASALALFGAVVAFGPSPNPLGVLVVYLVAAAVASITPTPGGLGAMETAMVAGLVRLGVSGGSAVAATLAFRLATFWLPLLVGSVLLQQARRRRWI